MKGLISFMKITLFSMWMIFVHVCIVNAQTLKGTITAESGNSLEFVNIFIRDVNLFTISDEEGKYEIKNIPAGSHNVEFSFVGYQKETKEITVSEDDIILNVILKIDIFQTGEVVVESKSSIADELKIATKSISILDSESLDKNRGQTLGESLEEVSGVTVLTTGPAIAKSVIRGLHSDRIVILNNGIQQESQQWGGEHAPAIDPFTPETIQVIKGAASVEYGFKAIGGVIRVDPREIVTTPGIGGSVSVNGFSNNRQGAGSLLLEGSFGNVAGWGWRLQGSIRKAGDSSAPRYNIVNSGFKEFDGSGAVGYKRGNHKIDVFYSQFSTEIGIFKGSHIGNLSDLTRAFELDRPLNTSDFSYDIDVPNQKIDHKTFSVRSHHRLNSIGNVDIQLGKQINHRREFDSHKTFLGDPSSLSKPSIELKLITYTLNTALTLNPGKYTFRKIGFNAMKQDNVEKGRINLIPNYRMYSGGLFFIEHVVIDNWNFELGIRYDRQTVDVYRNIDSEIIKSTHNYSNFSGVLGANIQFANHWSIGSNVSTGWRAPNMNELYSDGVHHGAAQYEKGDVNLDSEKSLNVDLTLRHINDKVTIELSGYNVYINDYIYLFPQESPILTVRGAFPAFNYVQDDVLLRGGEISVSYRITEFFSTGVKYSLVRGKNRKQDIDLVGLPADRIKSISEFTLPDVSFAKNQSIQLSLNVVDKQNRIPEGVDFVPPPPGYHTVDLDYFSDIMLFSTSFSFGISVDNVFNKSYRDYLSRFRYFTDDPGRSIVVRFELPFSKTLNWLEP